MISLSLRFCRKDLWVLMWFAHLLFFDILAFTPLFLEPGPFLLPLLFCSWFFLILYFDVPILFFSIMALSFIRDLISAFVIASFISSSLPGSSHTLLSEHFNTCAASLFCILTIIFTFPSSSTACLFPSFQLPCCFPLRLFQLFFPLPWPLLPSYPSFPLSLISFSLQSPALRLLCKHQDP